MITLSNETTFMLRVLRMRQDAIFRAIAMGRMKMILNDWNIRG